MKSDNLKLGVGLLCYPVTVLIISWIHYFNTASFRVDFNPVQPPGFRALLFAILVVVYTAYYIIVFKILFQKSQWNVARLRQWAYVFLLIAFLTLPIFSNDFFSLISYSQSYLNGYDIYTGFDAQAQTSFYDCINPAYARLNCKYGPVNVLLLCVPLKLGLKTIPQLIWSSKLIYLFFSVLYIETSLRLYLKAPLSYLPLIFIPIWYIQGQGQFHNDIMGVSLISLGYLLLLEKKKYYAVLCLTLAALSKFTFVIFLCLPILFAFEQSDKIRWLEFAKITGFTIISLLFLGYVFYIPFIDSMSDLLAPLRAMGGEIPSSTMADITSYILLVFRGDLAYNNSITVPLYKFVGLVLLSGISLLYLFHLRKKNGHRIFILCFFVALVMVYSHRFLPWYLMIIPLFSGFQNRKDWTYWILGISFISMFQDFAIFLGTDYALGKWVMAVSTLLTVLFYFYKFRSRHRYTL